MKASAAVLTTAEETDSSASVREASLNEGLEASGKEEGRQDLSDMEKELGTRLSGMEEGRSKGEGRPEPSKEEEGEREGKGGAEEKEEGGLEPLGNEEGKMKVEGGPKFSGEEKEGDVKGQSQGQDAEEELKSSSSETELKTLSPGRVSNSDSQLSSSDSQGDGLLRAHKRHQSGADEMLAIMGADTATYRKLSSHDTSESSSSADSLLSDHPCFLHVRVSHKCSAAHTYTPLNRAVGIDIPHNLASPKGTLQQVKTAFCFAVAERR